MKLVIYMIWLALARSPVGAMNYVGGFDDDGQCVQICSEEKAHYAGAFGKEPDISASNPKGSKAKDWDFLVIEQIFLPQYCRLLELGVDITVSHQDVAAYPEGNQ